MLNCSHVDLTTSESAIDRSVQAQLKRYEARPPIVPSQIKLLSGQSPEEINQVPKTVLFCLKCLIEVSPNVVFYRKENSDIDKNSDIDISTIFVLLHWRMEYSEHKRQQSSRNYSNKENYNNRGLKTMTICKKYDFNHLTFYKQSSTKMAVYLYVPHGQKYTTWNKFSKQAGFKILNYWFPIIEQFIKLPRPLLKIFSKKQVH